MDSVHGMPFLSLSTSVSLIVKSMTRKNNYVKKHYNSFFFKSSVIDKKWLADSPVYHAALQNRSANRIAPTDRFSQRS